MTALDLKDWFRAQCQMYTYDLRGIFRVAGNTQWPMTAANAAEFEALIREHLLPLPEEPAALANVLEVSIVDFLLDRIAETDGMLSAARGGERVYPDLEVTGPGVGGAFYAVDIFNSKVLNAADYGVPQLRPRLFVVGVPRECQLPELPEASHTGMWERQISGAGTASHVLAGQALDGLECEPEPGEVPGGQYAQLLPQIPPGENYLHFTAERGHPQSLFKWRSRYWSFLLKLDPARPSPTIQAQPGPNVGPFHWENRRLRVGEIKRLFTFPDDFELVGKRASIQAQLGNAVPPSLAEKVATQVIATIHLQQAAANRNDASTQFLAGYG